MLNERQRHPADAQHVIASVVGRLDIAIEVQHGTRDQWASRARVLEQGYAVKSQRFLRPREPVAEVALSYRQDVDGEKTTGKNHGQGRGVSVQADSDERRS